MRNLSKCETCLSVLLLFVSLTGLLSGSLGAQVIGTGKASATVPASISASSLSTKSLGLEIAATQAQLAQIEQDSDIDGVVRGIVLVKYKKALDLLKSAQGNVFNGNAFRAALKSAPLETGSLQNLLDAMQTIDPESEIYVILNIEDPEKAIKVRRANYAEARNEVEQVVGKLAATRARPPAIAARLLQLHKNLDDTESQIEKLDAVDTSSPVRAADRVLLKAQQQAQASEVAMLEQEKASQSVREDHLLVKRQLLDRQIENERVSLGILEMVVNQGDMLEAEGLVAQVKKMAQVMPDENAAAQALIAETQGLAQELIDTLGQVKETDLKRAGVSEKLAALTADFEGFQSRVKLGYLEGTYAQILLENRRRLPDPLTFDPVLKQGRQTLRKTRYDKFRVEMKIKKLRAAGNVIADNPSEKMKELLALREDLLGRLLVNYQTLVRDLTKLDAEQRAQRDEIVEIYAYLRETLFWQKSSPPIGLGEAVALSSTFHWLFDGKHLRESVRSLKWMVSTSPYLSVLLTLIVILLLFSRARFTAKITERGKLIRLISSDHFVHTFVSLLYTILIALPIPLVIGFIAWGFVRDPQGSDWLRGIAEGLKWVFFIMAGVFFLGSVCRQGGLGIVHFGWSEGTAMKLRRGLYLIVLGYVPAVLVMSSMLFEDSSQHFDSVGRFCFNLANVWALFIFWKFVHPSHGIFTNLIQAHPQRLFARFRYLWFALLLAGPVALVFMACLGYVFTAMALSFEFLGMLALVMIGTILYHLLLRWFIIKERRLALEEAIETRRKRREAAAQPEEQADEVVSVDAAEAELNLEKVGLQTRLLLRSLFTLGVIMATGMLWSSTMPLDQILGKITIGGGLNLFEVIQAMLIIACFAIVVVNLPGLLELIGLRKTVTQPGTRYAITKISQYALASIGFVLLFDILDLDWSKFAWIITALSVGLGFGLQEVVANLVCGIILLFERPIRIGDVVTINEVTGTVTRIRMRATTITNWDRKEFIVPNKQFVTGTLLNWTLSNSVVRIFISVGVAYGSDTEKARQILLSVCRENPLVLEEPPPQATFEEFGESSLTMNLRCYIHGLENRVAIISELHTDIDRLFKQAGIEIAFPQLGLHVKGGDSLNK